MGPPLVVGPLPWVAPVAPASTITAFSDNCADAMLTAQHPIPVTPLLCFCASAPEVNEPYQEPAFTAMGQAWGLR